MSETYKILSNFIRNRMRMSHIYQPAMLIELFSNGGSASVAKIAKALLARDLSQVEYYELTTKSVVGEVLTTNHQITEKVRKGRYIVGYRIPDFDLLSPTEVADLIDACLTRIDKYVESRGQKIWDHRKKSTGYIPGTLRYEVLKAAKLRCQLCGVSAEVKALEVDHIVPRNMGGEDDISNLQALCYSCNATKRDRDDTDFRGVAESYDDRLEGCAFCEVPTDRVIAENELCFAVRDQYPVTELHSLVIPKRHVSDFFDLYQPERNAIHAMLDEQRRVIQETDASVTGFNVGINAGEDAGQTISHCHVHLIPRRKGDIENPRGGVRGVIPDKRIY
jgi:ATP adenylyltransferase